MEIRSYENGSVLWFIMIAIVLLGAITMVISRGGSTVDQSGDFEQSRVKVTQLMRYASGIEQAIEKLRSINNCSENDISFENTEDLNYENTNSPDDNSCHIFEPEGAGLTWREFGSNNLAATGSSIAFGGDMAITGLGRDTANSGTDLIFYARISENLCDQVNREVSINASDTDITMTLDVYDAYFIGSYVGNNQYGIAGEAVAMEGRPTGCMIDDNGHYIFYHVLLTR